MNVKKKLNPNLYDTIFKAMFRGLDDNNEDQDLNLEIKKDFLAFYKKYCNPQSELQPEDIQPFNLLEKKIFGNSHNDTGYLTKENQLILLFEHQATYNPNMPSRLFNYYNILLNKFWKEQKVNLVSSKKFEPPAPELYVIEVFSSKEKPKSMLKKETDTYSVRIDPMFDPKGCVNRELIRFDATVIHFDTEEIYQKYLKGEKPEDLIHEFSLYSSMIHHELNELLANDRTFQNLVLERQRILEEEQEEKEREEKKKAIESKMTKIRNEMRNIAVKNTMKLFEKEKMFTKIFERMEEESMIDATIDMAEKESIEGIYAEFVLTILNERKQAEIAREQAEAAKEQVKTAKEQAKMQKEQAEMAREQAKEQIKKEREEKEKIKNTLVEIFGTDDLEEIRKMRK